MCITRASLSAILLLLCFKFSSANARPYIDWSFSYNIGSMGFVINDSESIEQDKIVFVASTSNLDYDSNGDLFITDEGERKFGFDRVHISEQFSDCAKKNKCTHIPHGIIIGRVNLSTNNVEELTLIGMTSPAGVYDLELDNYGHIYVVGSLQRLQQSNLIEYFPARNTLPSHNPYDQHEPGFVDKGQEDGFIIKLDKTGELLIASYYGGSGEDRINEIAVTNTGYAFVGNTSSIDLHTTGGSEYKGEGDGFLTVVDSNNTVIHSSYVGGASGDALQTLEDYGSKIIFGGTTRSNIEMSPDAFDTSLSGDVDGVIGFYEKKLNKINYLSYYGREGNEGIQKIQAMDNGDLYLGGTTNSPSLSIDGVTSGYLGPFVVKMKGMPLRQVNKWSYSYERVTASMADMTVDSDGNIAVAASCIGGGLVCAIEFYPHFNMLQETSVYEQEAFDRGRTSANFQNPSMLITWSPRSGSEPWTASFLPSFTDNILSINFMESGELLVSGFTKNTRFIDTTHSVRTSDFTFGAYLLTIKLGQIKNQKPTLSNDSVTVDVDGEVNFYPLQNDLDSDGYIIENSFHIVDYPKNGQIYGPHDGRVTFKPDLSYQGKDSFTYRVRDDAGEYGLKATVSIQVGEASSSGGDGSAPVWLLFMLLLTFAARRYYK
ncbi:hypothetical protein GCM10009123_06890 [Kangiella japonica]|uniref:Uncharacterized protein n=1 Tax=Kangiella japonica TaxID=647384 RepID=A0ABN0SVG3_9GAMM